MALNPLEQEALNAIKLMNKYLDVPKLGREKFVEMRDQMRKAIAHLENKMFGCPTGSHAGDCTCEHDKKGISMSTFYHHKKRSLLQ